MRVHEHQRESDERDGVDERHGDHIADLKTSSRTVRPISNCAEGRTDRKLRREIRADENFKQSDEPMNPQRLVARWILRLGARGWRLGTRV